MKYLQGVTEELSHEIETHSSTSISIKVEYIALILFVFSDPPPTQQEYQCNDL